MTPWRSEMRNTIPAFWDMKIGCLLQCATSPWSSGLNIVPVLFPCDQVLTMTNLECPEFPAAKFASCILAGGRYRCLCIRALAGWLLTT